MRSREIAKGLSLNRAVMCDRSTDRPFFSLPTKALERQRRFGKGPSILSSCFKSWQSSEEYGRGRGSGWLFQV